MIGQRQAEMIGEGSGAADSKDRAARFEKLAEFRHCLGRGDVAAAAAIFRRQALLAWRGRCVPLRWWLIAAGIALSARTIAGLASAIRNGAVHENEHVELVAQIAFVQ